MEAEVKPVDTAATPAAEQPASGPVDDAAGRRASMLQLVGVIGVMVTLALTVRAVPDGSVTPGAIFFLIATAIVDLIPVPAWGGLELSLSFPILLGVAMLYPPGIAGVIAFFGCVDPREFRREITLLRALWNRAQIASSILLGSWV